MRKKDHRRLLERAATASIERIRQDREKAPDKIRTLFPYIEEHLFREYLDVNRMRRDCGKRDHSISTFFCAATGQTPHAYITTRRIETSAALLRDTTLKGWMISGLVGFSSHPALTRNFRDWCGMSPRTFRSGVKKIFAEAGGRPRSGVPGVEEFRDTLAAGLESQAADRLVARIRSAIAREERSEPKLTGAKFLTPNAAECLKVEEIWAMLQEKTWPEQRELIRNRFVFSTPMFFHFVREKSIPEGRRDPKAGAHFALLAVDSLGITNNINDRECLRLKAQGWAWVGNARALALDFPGAEEAFRLAEDHFPRVEGEDIIHAELYELKATFRWWQNRPAEALDLHRNALPTIRSTGTKKQIAEALLLRSAILVSLGDIEPGIPYLHEARQLVGELNEPYLEFAATYNLATAMAKLGQYHEARGIMPEVVKLADGRKSKGAHCHVHWLEGVISRGLGDMNSAELQLRTARQGFEELHCAGHVAIVTLDLAVLYAKQQRSTEAQQLTLEVIPILEGLHHCVEAMVCLGLLQEAIKTNDLQADLFLEIRERLEQARVNPAGGFSVERSSKGEPVPTRFSD